MAEANKPKTPLALAEEAYKALAVQCAELKHECTSEDLTAITKSRAPQTKAGKDLQALMAKKLAAIRAISLLKAPPPVAKVKE